MAGVRSSAQSKCYYYKFFSKIGKSSTTLQTLESYNPIFNCIVLEKKHESTNIACVDVWESILELVFR